MLNKAGPKTEPYCTPWLVLIPPSAFAGDSEADVAEWKGKVQAIETAQIKKKCVSN